MGPNRAKLGQMGSNWVQWGQKMPKGAKQVQMGPNIVKLDPMGSNRAK